MAEKTPGFPKSSLCLSGRCVHHHHYPPANRPDEQNRLFGRLERASGQKHSNCKSAEKHSYYHTNIQLAVILVGNEPQKAVSAAFVVFTEASETLFREQSHLRTLLLFLSLRSHPSASSSASSYPGTSGQHRCFSSWITLRGFFQTGSAVVSAEAD